MLTPEMIEIARMVQTGETTIQKACEKHGYCRGTYHKWCRENKEFRALNKEIADQAKEEAITLAKSHAAQAIKLFIKAIEQEKGKVSRQAIDAGKALLAVAGLNSEVLYKNAGTADETPSVNLTAQEIKDRLEQRRKEKEEALQPGGLKLPLLQSMKP